MAGDVERERVREMLFPRSMMCNDEFAVWNIRALMELGEDFMVEKCNEDNEGNRGKFWRLSFRREIRPSTLADKIHTLPDAPENVKPARKAGTDDRKLLRRNNDG